MALKTLSTKGEGCEAPILRMQVGGEIFFPYEKRSSVKTSITSRIKKKFPDRRFSTKKFLFQQDKETIKILLRVKRLN